MDRLDFNDFITELEAYIADNSDEILDRAVIYGFYTEDDIRSIRNRFDLASILGGEGHYLIIDNIDNDISAVGDIANIVADNLFE